MAEGTVHTGSPALKMYAIQQIKICAEYRDMLPRPRLDFSGTPDTDLNLYNKGVKR